MKFEVEGPVALNFFYKRNTGIIIEIIDHIEYRLINILDLHQLCILNMQCSLQMPQRMERTALRSV